MSGLRSALEEYGVADVLTHPDARVIDDLSELQRVSGLLEIEKAVFRRPDGSMLEDRGPP